MKTLKRMMDVGRHLFSLSLLATIIVGGAISAEEQNPASSGSIEKKVESNESMFVHLFYFKFKEGVSDEEIMGLMQELGRVTKQIPEVKEFMVGKNIAPRTHGFQYGQVSIFDNPEGLKAYDRHPAHQEMVRKIIPKLVHGVTMDFVPIGDDRPKLSETLKQLRSGSQKKFIHAFSFKFKPDVSEEKIAGLMLDLANSKKDIPVLKEFLVGKNVARNSHGFQYGEIAVFDREKDHDVFQRHPEHMKLVPKIVPHMQMGLTMDFFPIDY